MPSPSFFQCACTWENLYCFFHDFFISTFCFSLISLMVDFLDWSNFLPFIFCLLIFCFLGVSRLHPPIILLNCLWCYHISNFKGLSDSLIISFYSIFCLLYRCSIFYCSEDIKYRFLFSSSLPLFFYRSFCSISFTLLLDKILKYIAMCIPSCWRPAISELSIGYLVFLMKMHLPVEMWCIWARFVSNGLS